MEDYPETLAQFAERFCSEEACREYIVSLRWPEGFRCPVCGYGKAWTTGRGLYQCTRCQHQTSATAGTLFQDTRKPLQMWFRAMWHVTSQKYGASALGVQRVLGLGSYHTAWTWLHKLRRAMVRPGRDRLSGIVEVDETYIGGPEPGMPGRGAWDKTLVVIAAEEDGRGIGRIRLCQVPDISSKSLLGVVEGSVEPGSTVRTDGLKQYRGVTARGYAHEVHRQDAEAPPLDDTLLPLVHRVASLLKRWLLGTHQGAVRPSHLQYYLDEFTFRFNRRTSRSRGKLFYRLMQQAVALSPVPAKQIHTPKSTE
jgi:transposase-like protein